MTIIDIKNIEQPDIKDELHRQVIIHNLSVLNERFSKSYYSFFSICDINKVKPFYKKGSGKENYYEMMRSLHCVTFTEGLKIKIASLILTYFNNPHLYYDTEKGIFFDYRLTPKQEVNTPVQESGDGPPVENTIIYIPKKSIVTNLFGWIRIPTIVKKSVSWVRVPKFLKPSTYFKKNKNES